ncbi:Pkinase-domain-containing protein [Backusella circina FSU 941]|nr:Pkinase-domain-containing protein [Backusella circina FSU 941]
MKKTPEITIKTNTLGHRREASCGLGIDTNPSTPSKTNAFFHTADIPTPRPPPSISRKISIKRESTSPTVETMAEIYENSGNSSPSIDSYASRLRNLVAATRQASVAPAPTPIPQHLNAKKPSKSSLDSELSPNNNTAAVTTATTTSSSTVTKHRSGFPSSYSSSSDDEIMPLPTPVQANSSGNNSTTPYFIFPKSHIKNVDPSEDHKEALSKKKSIPVISIHSFESTQTSIPQLSEQPMLGDNIIIEKQPKRRPLQREQQLSEEMVNIVGKQIGVYEICKLLGVGAFSQFIDHPNIVHLEATMETEHVMCIVLEYVEGGELFDFVQKMHHQLLLNKQKVDESLVKKIFLQLLRAVQWLHEHNIVHRDLKLENILIHNDVHGQPILKITDFGLARVVDPESPLLTTRCGSEEYTAPEIVQSKGYDGRKTDTWSLGVILYALLVGYLPFRYDVRKHERVSQLFYRIVRAEIKWPSSTNISHDAKEVVSRILESDPEKRIALSQVEKLPWFSTL